MIEVGEVFGKWTVLNHEEKTVHGAKQVKCRCECGRESVMTEGRLTNCRSRQCWRCARKIFRLFHI